jgi:hypothetical protein
MAPDAGRAFTVTETFHDGELYAQKQAGVAEEAAAVGESL